MKRIVSAACLLLSLSCAPLWAQYAFKVSSADRAALESLEVQPAWTRDYGGYLWLEGDDTFAAAMARSSISSEHMETAGILRVHDHAGDPITERAAFGTAPRTGDGRFLGLVQFRGPLLSEDLNALRAAGLEPVQYYPHHAYLVWGGDSAFEQARGLPQVRWSGDFGAQVRVQPALSTMGGVIRNVNVHFYNDGDTGGVLAALDAAGARLLDHWRAQPDGRLWDAKVEVRRDRLEALAAIPQVVSLTFLSPEPQLEDESAAQTLAGNLDVSNAPVPGYMDWLDDIELDGSGVIWSITDTGVWYGHGDYNSRIVGGFSYPGCSAPNPGDENPGNGGHGTHVAGIIGGDGAAGFTDPDGHLYGLGMAPGYSIFAQNPICSGSASWPPAGGWQVLSRNALDGGAIGSNNSWTSGEGTAHGYQATERTHDIMALDGDFDSALYEPFIIVFSAGNSGPGSSTLTSPKEAKNVIVTGGTQTHRVSGDVDAMYNSSSRGPAVDGRTLPTIAAPGQQVSSTIKPNNAQCGSAIGGTDGAYAFCTGTSMAAPHASGSVVLMAEWWRNHNGGEDFSPAMAKALLVNGAAAISGASAPPNNDVGWGRIDLRPMLDSDLSFEFVDQEVLFENSGEEWSEFILVDDPLEPFKVSLVWSDAPGAVGADPALVNDLDLEVEMDGETFLGNALSGGWSVPGGTPDRLNNLESVFVETPVSFGSVTVRAHQIAGSVLVNDPGVDTAQHFALVCQNCSFGGFVIDPPSAEVCTADGSVDFALTLTDQFQGTTNLSSSGEPAGTSGNFSPNPVIFPEDQSTYTLSGLAGAAGGDYTLAFTATDDGDPGNTAMIEAGLAVFEDVSDPPGLLAPADGATDVDLQPEFTWDAVSNVVEYHFQVTEVDSGLVVIDELVPGTSFTPDTELASGTEYSWRVIGVNACGWSDPGSTFQFRTRFIPVAEVIPETFAFEVPQGGNDDDTLSITNSGTGNLTWEIATDQIIESGPGLRSHDPALDEVFEIDDFAIDSPANGGSPEVQMATAGVATRGEVVGFSFEGTVSGISGNSNWASDMCMIVESPDGATFAVGGFDGTQSGCDVNAWDFDGGGSTSDGTYASTHDDVFDPAEPDEGEWTFTFINDWNSASAATMSWTDVTVTLHKQPLPVCFKDLNEVPWLSASPDSGSTGAGLTDEATVTVDASGMTEGQYEAYLCLTTNDLDREVIPLPVELTVTEVMAGQLAVDPAALDFGEVTVGDALVDSFTVSNAAPPGSLNFVLTAFEVSAGETVFEITDTDCNLGQVMAPGDACIVEVSFAPDAVGAMIGEVLVDTDQGQSETVALAGTGVQDPGELEVTPLSLDFGDTAIGGTATGMVMINNIAAADAADLELTQLEIITGQDVFVIDAGNSDCGQTLAPQTGCTVAVNYSPDAVAADSGLLRVVAEGKSAVNVGLSGNGIEPEPTVFEDRFEEP